MSDFQAKMGQTIHWLSSIAMHIPRILERPEGQIRELIRQPNVDVRLRLDYTWSLYQYGHLNRSNMAAICAAIARTAAQLATDSGDERCQQLVAHGVTLAGAVRSKSAKALFRGLPLPLPSVLRAVELEWDGLRTWLQSLPEAEPERIRLRRPVQTDHHAPISRHAAASLNRISSRPISIQPGSVVWVPIPFREQPDAHKTRPALVLRVMPHDAEVCPIMGEATTTGALGISFDWRAAGLSKPSRVCFRPVLVERRSITEVVGWVELDSLEPLMQHHMDYRRRLSRSGAPGTVPGT